VSKSRENIIKQSPVQWESTPENCTVYFVFVGMVDATFKYRFYCHTIKVSEPRTIKLPTLLYVGIGSSLLHRISTNMHSLRKRNK